MNETSSILIKEQSNILMMLTETSAKNKALIPNCLYASSSGKYAGARTTSTQAFGRGQVILQECMTCARLIYHGWRLLLPDYYDSFFKLGRAAEISSSQRLQI